MSLWINRLQCKTCGSEINITGGMVQTTWMGPASEDVFCPNPCCHAQGLDKFYTLGPIDSENPEHRTELIRNNHIDN